VPLRPPLHTHDQHTHRLLSEIEAGKQVSQRSLARSLGIALGLTNLLLRRLVRKGWVRMVQVKPNRVMYLLTPAGILQKAQMSRAYLASSVKFYAEARTRISERFAALSAEWPTDNGNNGHSKRIVFYGTGELAEIAFICLQESDLELVGVIDDSSRKQFFNVPVYSAGELKGCAINGRTFDRLIVMTIEENESTKAILKASEVPVESVSWL
jgi:DNA-binding MarR family transcriptional regulator